MYRIELENGMVMCLCEEHVRLYSVAAWSVEDSDGPCMLCPGVN